MTKIPSSLLEQTLWNGVHNPIWLTTIFSLNRNFANALFPAKMNVSEMQQMLDLLSRQTGQISCLQQPVFLPASSLTPFEKEFLFERYFCPEALQNSGEGQGFILDLSHPFFAEINFSDHLQLHWIDSSGEWEKGWESLNKIESALNQAHDFSFSPKFGYLTSSILFCGTALTVRALLHVPALIHSGELEEALLKQKEEGVIFLGLGGKIEETTADLIFIQNHYTLGENEETILHHVYSMAMKLMALEKGVRTHLKSENSAEIKDRLSRAYGLLLHSYQLHTKEALDNLSLLKLGLHFEWITGISEQKLNQLFFLVQRGHLLHHLNQFDLPLTEIPHKRAEFLHESLKEAVLKC